jgi:hypothetical protein
MGHKEYIGRGLLFGGSLIALWGILASGACGPGESAWAQVPAPEPLSPLQIETRLGPEPPSVRELFTSDDLVEFVLASDFDRLKKDRSQESEEIPGQILVRGSNGEAIEIPIQVRTRGNFRLQRRICPDPPLRLNFPESEPYGTVFDGQDKLKLVTHCRDSRRYEQNTMEEYLAYRIYNHLTEISFRVQLAKITYMDTSGKNDPIQRLAFLIEDEEGMAARLGGALIEAENALPTDFDLDQLSLLYIFQYMVGNVDWGTGTSHNIKIIHKDMGYHPVPYDFDWTGLVDAPYAAPNRLTAPYHDEVRERLYWGVCLPGIDYQRQFDRFNAVREAVLDQVRNQVGLDERNVRSAVEYLEEFYEIINDPWESRASIITQCRQWNIRAPGS